MFSGTVLSFSWYLAFLSSFCFFSHPIVSCVLLVLSVISLSWGVYAILGFSWYLAMFCMVYIGGVYVLLIFVFLSLPNTGISGGFGCWLWILGIFLVSNLVFSSINCLDLAVDVSQQLTSFGYRWGYLFLCSGMLISLVEVSLICSKKNSFFR